MLGWLQAGARSATSRGYRGRHAPYHCLMRSIIAARRYGGRSPSRSRSPTRAAPSVTPCHPLFLRHPLCNAMLAGPRYECSCAIAASAALLVAYRAGISRPLGLLATRNSRGFRGGTPLTEGGPAIAGGGRSPPLLFNALADQLDGYSWPSCSSARARVQEVQDF